MVILLWGPRSPHPPGLGSRQYSPNTTGRKGEGAGVGLRASQFAYRPVGGPNRASWDRWGCRRNGGDSQGMMGWKRPGLNSVQATLCRRRKWAI